MNGQVTEYFSKTQPWQQEVSAKLRESITKTIPDHEERLQYGKPHYLKDGSYAAVIHAAKDKMSLMLFNADSTEPVKGFIRSMGKGERKSIDISEGQDVDYAIIEALICRQFPDGSTIVNAYGHSRLRGTLGHRGCARKSTVSGSLQLIFGLAESTFEVQFALQCRHGGFR